MTKSEILRLRVVLASVAQLYSRNLSDGAIAMMTSLLEDLELNAVTQALKDYMADARNTQFPLPAVIRSKIIPFIPPPTIEDDAREVASRMISAVSKYGWPNPDRACSYIGELGWAVVDRMGGWVNFCASVTPENIGVISAQIRELTLSMVRRYAAGEVEAPSYPRIANGLNPGALLKRIPGNEAH